MELGGFSKDLLKGKQLSLMFLPDALVIFRAKGTRFRCFDQMLYSRLQD